MKSLIIIFLIFITNNLYAGSFCRWLKSDLESCKSTQHFLTVLERSEGKKILFIDETEDLMREEANRKNVIFSLEWCYDNGQNMTECDDSFMLGFSIMGECEGSTFSSYGCYFSNYSNRVSLEKKIMGLNPNRILGTSLLSCNLLGKDQIKEELRSCWKDISKRSKNLMKE